MLVGAYPFRCLQCSARFWISVWLFSRLTTAKCPKCLRSDLIAWPEKYYRPSFWRRLQYTLGAHRYRCAACRYNFVSFRARSIDKKSSQASAHNESLQSSGQPEQRQQV